MEVGGSLSLLDWRRRVAALYAGVRAEVDPAAAHAGWCSGRAALLTTHPDSPVPADRRAGYPGPVVAPYDPAFRFESALEDAEPSRLRVPPGTDGVVTFDRLGRLTLGRLGTLDVWWLVQYGGGVFVPVKDASAGAQTYGGGRYVLDTVKGADLGNGPGGTLVVDFNFAYHPSCFYDPAWACPLAPPGNTLADPVPVGELAA